VIVAQNDQEQNLAKRIGDLPGLPRILEKVIEQQAKPGLG
jgi:HD-like signal output (HDOD) protein